MKIKSFLITAVLATAILFSAGFANAQSAPTQEQLTQQLIQVMRQVITQLQARISDIIAQRAAQNSTTPGGIIANPNSVINPYVVPVDSSITQNTNAVLKLTPGTVYKEGPPPATIKVAAGSNPGFIAYFRSGDPARYTSRITKVVSVDITDNIAKNRPQGTPVLRSGPAPRGANRVYFFTNVQPGSDGTLFPPVENSRNSISFTIQTGLQPVPISINQSVPSDVPQGVSQTISYVNNSVYAATIKTNSSTDVSFVNAFLMRYDFPDKDTVVMSLGANLPPNGNLTFAIPTSVSINNPDVYNYYIEFIPLNSSSQPLLDSDGQPLETISDNFNVVAPAPLLTVTVTPDRQSQVAGGPVIWTASENPTGIYVHVWHTPECSTISGPVCTTHVSLPSPYQVSVSSTNMSNLSGDGTGTVIVTSAGGGGGGGGGGNIVTWTGSSKDKNWNNANNWSTGIPQSGSAVDIGSAQVTVPLNYTLNLGSGTVSGTGGSIIDSGDIAGGTFNVPVTINQGGTIHGGTFTDTSSGVTINGGTVFNDYTPTFNGPVMAENSSILDGGTYNGAVTIESSYAYIYSGQFKNTVNTSGNGRIFGGTFSGTVNNSGIIDTDYGYVISGSGTINGNVTVESRGTLDLCSGLVITGTLTNNGGAVNCPPSATLNYQKSALASISDALKLIVQDIHKLFGY